MEEVIRSILIRMHCTSVASGIEMGIGVGIGIGIGCVYGYMRKQKVYSRWRESCIIVEVVAK